MLLFAGVDTWPAEEGIEKDFLCQAQDMGNADKNVTNEGDPVSKFIACI